MSVKVNEKLNRMLSTTAVVLSCLFVFTIFWVLTMTKQSSTKYIPECLADNTDGISGFAHSDITESEENGASNILLEYLKRENLPSGVVITAMVIAFLWGAGHAIQPGHGKTLVAAYLIGTRGRAIDAVWLGIIITISHIASIVIIGIIAWFASEYIEVKKLSFWISLVSGVAIVIIGIWLLIKRLTKNHLAHLHRHKHLSEEHTHSKNDAHDNFKDVEHKKSKWDIITLAVSGGIVPCPSAIVLLLMAISIDRILWGLVLIITFSIGLAVVLISIGLLTLYARHFFDKLSGTEKFVRIISIVSAIFIIIIGSSIIYMTIMKN